MPPALSLVSQARLQRLLYAVFITMLCAMVGVYMYLDYQHIRTAENDKLTTQANVVSVNIEQHIISIDRMIEEILALRQFVDAEQQRDHIQSLVNAMPIIRTISILNADGVQIMGTRDLHNGYNFSHRPYFLNVLDDPQPLKLHISPPYLTVRGDITLALSKAIHDQDNLLQGVVLVALEPLYIKRLMDTTLYAPDMWALLRHIDGDTVFQVLGGIPGERHDAHSSARGMVPLPLPPRDGSPLILPSLEDGSEQMVSNSTVAGYSAVEALPLQVIMGRNYSTLMGDWYRFAWLQAGLLVLFIITTTVGLVFLQHRQKRFAARRAEYLRRLRLNQQRIHAQERDFRIIVERTSTCIVRLDPKGSFSYVNPAFCGLFGLSTQEAKGVKFSSLIAEPDIASTQDMVQQALAEPSEQQFRAQSTTPQGLRHMEWALCSVVGPDNRMQGVIGIGHDITVYITLNEKLRTLAERDGLTGLYNRRHFMEAGEIQVAHAHRYGQPLSFILLDLDHFKSVNDTYGHHVGDITLQVCASLMQQVCRESDLPIRVGGEEFGILLPSTPSEGAFIAAQRLRQLIEDTSIPLEDGTEFHVTASLGVATLQEGETLENLMLHADQALYRAKQNGRNRTESSPGLLLGE